MTRMTIRVDFTLCRVPMYIGILGTCQRTEKGFSVQRNHVCAHSAKNLSLPCASGYAQVPMTRTTIRVDFTLCRESFLGTCQRTEKGFSVQRFRARLRPAPPWLSSA